MEYPSERFERLNRDYRKGSRVGRNVYAIAAFLQVFCCVFIWVSMELLDQMGRRMLWEKAVMRALHQTIAQPRTAILLSVLTLAFCFAAGWSGANVGEAIVAGKIQSRLEGASKLIKPTLVAMAFLLITNNIIEFRWLGFIDLLITLLVCCLFFVPVSMLTGLVAFEVTRTFVKRRLSAG